MSMSNFKFALVANVSTRIFLPSIADSISDTGQIYRALFDLNDAQLGLLADVAPKRDFSFSIQG